jgi:hypothetical protein
MTTIKTLFDRVRDRVQEIFVLPEIKKVTDKLVEVAARTEEISITLLKLAKNSHAHTQAIVKHEKTLQALVAVVNTEINNAENAPQRSGLELEPPTPDVKPGSNKPN